MRPRGSRRIARIFHLSILLQGVLPMHSASLRCSRRSDRAKPSRSWVEFPVAAWQRKHSRDPSTLPRSRCARSRGAAQDDRDKNFSILTVEIQTDPLPARALPCQTAACRNYPFTKLLNYQIIFTGFLLSIRRNAAAATVPAPSAIADAASHSLQCLHATA